MRGMQWCVLCAVCWLAGWLAGTGWSATFRNSPLLRLHGRGATAHSIGGQADIVDLVHSYGPMQLWLHVGMAPYSYGSIGGQADIVDLCIRGSLQTCLCVCPERRVSIYSHMRHMVMALYSYGPACKHVYAYVRNDIWSMHLHLPL